MLLVERGLLRSRARAQAAIAAGLVRVDGIVATRPSQSVPDGALIEAAEPHPYVSRGGLKLAHGLDTFAIDCRDRICLDIGASTGGFTEVLCQRGARRVYAVDVGAGQLHASLRADPRVVALEGTDARTLTTDLISEPPDLLVCDASFIPAALVLPRPLSLLVPGGIALVLVKPQFEVGRKKIGKGGIVRDETAQAEAVAGVADFLSGLGLRILGSVESPVSGSDGNREWLMAAQVSGYRLAADNTGPAG